MNCEPHIEQYSLLNICFFCDLLWHFLSGIFNFFGHTVRNQMYTQQFFFAEISVIKLLEVRNEITEIQLFLMSFSSFLLNFSNFIAEFPVIFSARQNLAKICWYSTKKNWCVPFKCNSIHNITFTWYVNPFHPFRWLTIIYDQDDHLIMINRWTF